MNQVRRWLTLVCASVWMTSPCGAQTNNASGWTEATGLIATVLGPHRYYKTGPFVADYQLDDPKKALAACRRYPQTGYQPSFLPEGCIVFFYPSTRTLAQASEARAIYEGMFKGATDPVERILRAMKAYVGEDIEIQAGATPEVLNTIVSNFAFEQAMTVAEAYAYRNRGQPAVVQWLYDHGARLCEKDWGPPKKRFSCYSFYSMNDTMMPRFDATLDVLERNGFRPRSAAEIDRAMSMVNVVPSRRMESHNRYYALLDPPVRVRVEAKRRADIAASEAAKLAKTRAEGGAPATETENLTSVSRLAEPGTPVCRPLVVEGTKYRFAATVEGASRTRLKLRAGSIRSENREVTNLPYRDTRISPGTLFWDDAGLWSTC